MRKKLVAGNWKMNLTATEAAAVVEAFVGTLEHRTATDVVVCPPYLALHRVRELLKKGPIFLGAQDVFWKDSGAFTGEISAPMLRDSGVSHCIVGHSETRGKFGKLEVPKTTVGYFAETDETINLKIRSLLYHSIVPILCVGETEEERDAEQTDLVVREQIAGALAGIEGAEFSHGVLAYEPVWAIGTGKTCDAAEAGRVCGVIRQVLSDVLDPEAAETIRILYGGSVKSSNSGTLFAMPNIDGGLVGGASLDPNEFSMIVLSA